MADNENYGAPAFYANRDLQLHRTAKDTPGNETVPLPMVSPVG